MGALTSLCCVGLFSVFVFLFVVRVDACRCVDAWMRGCVDVWMCGCVDVWTCGRVDKEQLFEQRASNCGIWGYIKIELGSLSL